MTPTTATTTTTRTLCLVLSILWLCSHILKGCSGVNMQQFLQSLEIMRNGCAPKFNVPLEILNRIRDGDFEVEYTQDLMCYVKCVAQLGGTVSKKGDFSPPKAIAQTPIILPPEIQEAAKNAIQHCKDAQKPYKESCERVFHSVRCIAAYDRASFKFP